MKNSSTKSISTNYKFLVFLGLFGFIVGLIFSYIYATYASENIRTFGIVCGCFYSIIGLILFVSSTGKLVWKGDVLIKKTIVGKRTYLIRDIIKLEAQTDDKIPIYCLHFKDGSKIKVVNSGKNEKFCKQVYYKSIELRLTDSEDGLNPTDIDEKHEQTIRIGNYSLLILSVITVLAITAAIEIFLLVWLGDINKDWLYIIGICAQLFATMLLTAYGKTVNYLDGNYIVRKCLLFKKKRPISDIDRIELVNSPKKLHYLIYFKNDNKTKWKILYMAYSKEFIKSFWKDRIIGE